MKTIELRRWPAEARSELHRSTTGSLVAMSSEHMNIRMEARTLKGTAVRQIFPKMRENVWTYVGAIGHGAGRDGHDNLNLSTSEHSKPVIIDVLASRHVMTFKTCDKG